MSSLHLGLDTRRAKSLALAGAVAVALLTTGTSHAAPISVGASFSGPPQNFNATLTATGTASIVGSGVIRHNPSTPFVPDVTANFSINQTNLPVTLTGGSVALVSDPIANNTLGFDDFTLGNKSIAGTIADIKDGSVWAFSFNPVNVTVNVNIGGIITVPITAVLNANGTISNFGFTQAPGTSLANLGAGMDYALPGTFNAGLAGNVNATIFGSSVLNQPFNAPASLPGVLPGTMTLTDAEPIINPFPHDVFAQLDGLLSSLSVPLAFSTPAVGTNPNPGNGQTAVTSYNFTFGLNLNVGLNNPSYHLQTTLPDTLVPEPSTWLLGCMGAMGLVGVALRRRAA